MNLFWIVNKVRYWRPIETFIDTLPVTIIAGNATYALDHFFNLFHGDLDLWIILAVAILVDFFTGIVASKIRKNPVTSLGARQTIVKCIEYILFLGLLIMISNGAEKYVVEDNSWIVDKLAFIIKDADVIGFFIAIWIEVISIVENMTDKSGAIAKIVEKIRRIINKELKE